MERFLPVIRMIQTRLGEILERNKLYMTSWDLSNIDDVGGDLIDLSIAVHPALFSLEHRILSLSLREAGLGIKNRVSDIRGRGLNESDKEYFRSVHEALGNLYEKMRSGEYYQALLEMASKSKK